MTAANKLAVVAIGGNSLIRDKQHESIPDQYGQRRSPRTISPT